MTPAGKSRRLTVWMSIAALLAAAQALGHARSESAIGTSGSSPQAFSTSDAGFGAPVIHTQPPSADPLPMPSSPSSANAPAGWITVTGTVEFHSVKASNAGTAMGVYLTAVEIWDANVNHPNVRVATDCTDTSGRFSQTLPNTDAVEGGALDLFLIVRGPCKPGVNLTYVDASTGDLAMYT